MTLSLEQTFKKRLQLIARERNLTPAEVWQNVILERFLVRLCQSSYRDHFILKGGTLLARHVNIGRETRDLDFTVEHLKNDAITILNAIQEITTVAIDDGFEFKQVQVEPFEHFHMAYAGVCIRVDVGFGKARLSLFIDLAFGDHVKAKEDHILLLASSKGPLFEPHINLKCYPMEFVFAEKLETVVFRGAANSRMKDFHDLFTMVNEAQMLDGPETKSAVVAVFKHRGTPLNLPLNFEANALQILQHYWHRYRPTVSVQDSLPENIQDVIGEINGWMQSHELFEMANP